MEISNITKKRVREYLSEKKRFDARDLLEYRKIHVETGINKKAEGSAKVKFGNTEVFVGVKMDVTEPYTDHEDEGTLITTAELLPLSSENFEYGPPRIEAIELARVVDRGLRESGFIDFKKLCIKKGEKVWNIFLDIYTINDDGNLLDAACLGAVAALLSARLPKYDEKKGVVKYGEHINKKLPLTKAIPFAMTFHKIGKSIIVDPIREEEEASEGRLTVTFSSDKKFLINAMQKGKESCFTKEEIFKILEFAEKKSKEIFPKILKIIENK